MLPWLMEQRLRDSKPKFFPASSFHSFVRRLRLMLAKGWQPALALLNVLPLPGLGAIVVGRRNAHTKLLRNGILQTVLVIFGSWPLVVPGALGFGWAIVDAVRIARARLIVPPTKMQADSPVETT